MRRLTQFRNWLQKKLTWKNTLRGGGLTGMAYLVLLRPHPDTTIVLALCAMMGLPTFFQGVDKTPEERKKDE